MFTPFLDPFGNSISEEELLGYGRSGVVILMDKVAVKLPLRYSYTSDDEVMETDDDNGYSIQTNIGQLGKVIYEVITGKDCRFDLHENDVCRATLPRRETLPSTQDIWLGIIIEKCWMPGAHRNANNLVEELDAVSLKDAPSKYRFFLAIGTLMAAAWLLSGRAVENGISADNPNGGLLFP